MIFPYSRRKDLNVILFLSIFSTERSLSEITLKVSFITRVLTIFRVTNLYWIKDINNRKLEKIISDITNYALQPPYLKKDIPLKKSLSKAGLLNPINIPSHIVAKEPIEGEYRIGKKGIFGLKDRIQTKSKIILITDSNTLKFREYNIYPYYNGFKFYFLKIDNLKKFDNLIIGSRSGKDPLAEKNEIKKLYESKGISLLIGPPEGKVLKEFDIQHNEHIYNFIPHQGVKDIRAEEALLSSLSVLNFILG